MSLTACSLMHNAACSPPVLLHVVIESVEIQLQFMVGVAVVCWLAKQVRIAFVQPSVESQNIIPGSFFGVARLEQLPHAIRSYCFSIFFHHLDFTRSERPGKRPGNAAKLRLKGASASVPGNR